MTLKSLALSLTLLGTIGAFAQTVPTDPPALQPDIQRQCNAEADRNNMNAAERDTFLRECAAGKTLDHPSPDKSAPPTR